MAVNSSGPHLGHVDFSHGHSLAAGSEVSERGFVQQHTSCLRVHSPPRSSPPTSCEGGRDSDWPRPLRYLVKVKVAQSCPTLCDPMNYTVHGILQARILEWGAVSFSRGSSQPRSPTLQADSLPSEPQGEPHT